ncbi:MAG: protein translocase subunit SecF [Candidatus Taylorbacteria bacterium]|nr:protein translocase subunit SecF [Candidatus Taylorbacteria bacterium]
MFVVKYRKIFYAFSVVLMVVSIGAVAVFGLQYGIDFKGGSLLEVKYETARPDKVTVENLLAPLKVGASVRPTGEAGYLIRMNSLTQPERENVLRALSQTSKAQEVRFDSIGPVLGKEAARNAYASITLVLIAIVLFVAYAFRQVSEPVSSWKYGFVAVIALLHDVIIPTGVFAILGHYLGYEVDTLFVTALLVVLGFSVHDTIVVFDRVRENLRHGKREDFETTVGRSVSQTFARSINTSFTTLLALIALYVFGGEGTHHFSLALIIGIAAGTYSSIFIGSPLLVTLQKWQDRKRKNK